MTSYVLFHSSDVFSIILHLEDSENKEKPMQTQTEYMPLSEFVKSISTVIQGFQIVELQFLLCVIS